MNDLICRVMLLAARGRIDNMARGFRARRNRVDTDDVFTGLMILAAVIAVIWLLSYIVRVQERRGAYISSAGLFLSLCKAHGLQWSQRWLLWRVGRAQRLRELARLFLEPERLEPARLGPAFAVHAAELIRLRRQLFSEPSSG